MITADLDRRVVPAGKRRRKQRPEPGNDRSWSVRYALGAYAVSLVADFVLAAIFTRSQLRLGLGVLAIDLTMLALLVPLYRAGRLTARDLGLRSTSPPRAIGSVVLAVVVYLVLAAVWTVTVIRPARHTTVPQLGDGTAGTILAGFAICISAPVVEELFFRGLVYRALRNRLPVAWSALIVGVLFAAVHGSTYPLDTLPIKFAFGVIACLLYEWTGSLWPSIALHSLVDSAGFEASVSHGKLVFAGVAFLALAAGLLLRHRFRRPTEDELRAVRPRSGRPAAANPAPVLGVHELRDTGRLDAAADAITVVTGGRSSRRLLAYAGMLLIVAGVVFSLVAPGHAKAHTAGGTIVGFILLAGVACLVVAVAWKLFGRGPRPGP